MSLPPNQRMKLPGRRGAGVRQPGTGASDGSVYCVVVFKWNPKKAAANLKTHAIGFHEAATVLNDTLTNEDSMMKASLDSHRNFPA